MSHSFSVMWFFDVLCVVIYGKSFHELLGSIHDSLIHIKHFLLPIFFVSLLFNRVKFSWIVSQWIYSQFSWIVSQWIYSQFSWIDSQWIHSQFSWIDSQWIDSQKFWIDSNSVNLNFSLLSCLNRLKFQWNDSSNSLTWSESIQTCFESYQSPSRLLCVHLIAMCWSKLF